MKQWKARFANFPCHKIKTAYRGSLPLYAKIIYETTGNASSVLMNFPQKFPHSCVFCLKHLIRRSLHLNEAFVHENNPVGNISGKLHLMGDDHHGDIQIRQGSDHLQHLAGQLRIQREVGSSKKRIFGFSARARAMATAWHWPPDS